MEQLKEYEIWQEGYKCTGGYEPSSLIGKAIAINFKQACHIVMCQEYLKSVDRNNYSDRFDYDPYKLTYWGCRLYDNEKDAGGKPKNETLD